LGGALTPESRYIPDDTIGALAQLLGHRVALVDDKVLVEDLEHLASLQIRHCRDLLASLGKLLMVTSPEADGLTARGAGLVRGS